MKSLFICALVILSTYEIFARNPEMYFRIDDNSSPAPTYYIKAIRISHNDPLFGLNFMEVDDINHQYDTVYSYNKANMTEPTEIFEFVRGFNYLRCPGHFPMIGEGKLRFEIYRNDNLVFQFSIDLVSSIGSPDILFKYYYENSTLTGEGSGSNPQIHQISNNSFINCWDILDTTRDITSYVNQVTLTNQIDGLVENNIKTSFNSATMGFPYSDVQLGFQYSPGNNVRLWRGVKYSISTSHTSYIKNGINYNFRNWDNYENYSSTSTLRVEDYTDKFMSNYYPTIPLTIANNLEDGSSNNEYELTWQTPPTSQNWQFGNIFNAFSYSFPNYDRYAATVPNSFQALSTTWWFQNWEDGSTYNEKSNIQVTLPGTTITANYKGHLRSNSQTALNDGPQRRLVRTDNGIYHLVYESMGWSWYTYSLTTNFNGSWSDEECLWGKNPSIDYEGNIVKIVQESQFDPGVILLTYEPDANGHYYNPPPGYEIVTMYDLAYYGNSKPVVLYNSDRIFVAYRKDNTGGIYQKTKYYDNGSWHWTSESTMPNTNSSSSNPSVSGWSYYLFFVYQQSQAINYMYGHWESPVNNWTFWSQYYATLSTGSGFRYNYLPSISRTLNSKIIVSWIGSDGIQSGGIGTNKGTSDEGTETAQPQVVIRVGSGGSSVWGSFYKVGDNVSSAVNNSVPASGFEATIIAWAEDNGTNYSSKWIRRTSSGYTDAYPLSSNGKQVQISNGSALDNIGGCVLSTSSTPYDMALTTTAFNQDFASGEGTNKISDYIDIAYGREGVIAKNGIEFLFDIGDIIVDDSVIKFIGCPDTVAYSSQTELNDLVRSESFELNPGSEFYFTDFYYVLDREEADSLLTEDDIVNFKAELVSEMSGEVVGTFDNITYSREQLEKYSNISYQVNCSNLNAGNYYLRLKTSVQGDAEYFLGNVQNGGEELNKKGYNQINFDGTKLPISYDLSQNFPNPFNPATTINYQMPENGFVTLKIYDILGKEVATLVNEQKNQGRYSVTFDASRLASGVYIYQLRVNDYVSSKKRLLLK